MTAWRRADGPLAFVACSLRRFVNIGTGSASVGDGDSGDGPAAGRRVGGVRLTVRAARAVGAVLAVWTLLFAGYGCPWFVNMADQQSVRPYEQAPRPAVAGTIPVGYPTPPAITYDDANKLKNPHPPTEASLARGQQLFVTYCQVCHGPQGHGDGPVVAKFIRPPDLHGASRGYSDGYIYALITNGRGNMPSYNRISPEERWDLINYLRRLQSRS